MAFWNKDNKKKQELKQLKEELRSELLQEVKEEVKKEYKEKIKEELKQEISNELKTPGEKIKEKFNQFGETMAKGIGSKANIFDNSSDKVHNMLNTNSAPNQKIKKPTTSYSVINEDRIRKMLSK